ncbi:aspartyl protease family protein [Sphingomonas sp. LB-2]|uniref:aspartyl protease family protein n=1 Tax=Sphingomonas caeni TaxID=2984949 RepID=UPI00222F0AD9|nr:aspartyl protease family protein [Sphingomonas caeni]MCW3846106.1 aspartyl protease family protein [Sphingomonas caeni]
MTRRFRLLAGGLFALLLASQPALAQQERVTGWGRGITGQTFFAAGESEEWLPFVRTQGGQIALHGTVNGKPVLALIDTGAPYTAIDTRFARENGIRLVQTMAPGKNQLRVFAAAIDSMQMGPITQQGGRLSSIDLSPMARVMNQPLTMVLGADYLRNVALEIDFDRGRLRLRASGSKGPEGVAVALSIWGIANRFLISMKVGDVSIPRVLIDTGINATLSVTTPIWKRLPLDPARVTSAQAYSLYGPETWPLARLEGVAIGGATIPGRMDVLADPDGILDSPVEGLIGIEGLRVFNLFLDARAHVMILSPRLYPHRFPAPSTLGVLGFRVPEGFSAKHIMVNSPAAKAGMVDGDVICRVNGQSIASGEPMAREDWAGKPVGTRLELGLCSGKTVAVTLAEFY